MSFKCFKSISVCVAALLAVVTSFPLSAQPATADCQLRMATGPKNGVYTQLAQDIARVCEKAVSLCQVPSTGGIRNLLLLSANEADIGFVQADVVQEMARGGDPNLQELQAIFPMHSNLLHIVTLSEGSKASGGAFDRVFGSNKLYRKFSDLRGATIAVSASAHVLGQALEKKFGYGMNFVLADDDEAAIAMLQKNAVQAAFLTGGWPYPVIRRVDSKSGLMLAEYDVAPYAPLSVVKRSYENMGAYNTNFLAAPNVLVTRPFKVSGARGKLVQALQTCLVNHLDELQEGHYHAAWKELKSTAETFGIARFPKGEAPRVAHR